MSRFAMIQVANVAMAERGMMNAKGKVEIIMYEGGYVEVHSNFVYPEQVREVLDMAVKAMRSSQVMGGLEIGKTQPNQRPEIYGN